MNITSVKNFKNPLSRFFKAQPSLVSLSHLNIFKYKLFAEQIEFLLGILLRTLHKTTHLKAYWLVYA